MRILILLTIYNLLFGIPKSFCQKNVEDTKIPYTIRDRDLMREILITMKMGFENTNKLIQVNRELIQANRELIRANRENTDKRMAFLETLVITLLTVVITQLGYTIWSDSKDRQLRQRQSKAEKSEEFISAKEFQKVLQRLEELEKEKISTKI